MSMKHGGVDDLVAANRANWDARARVHLNSPFYDLQRYVDDRSFVSEDVREAERALGDVAGLEVLNLQCHLGTDSISLVRLGARVTGLDFSPESLRIARALADRAGASVPLVCADVRSTDRVLTRRFDLVYASVGILCWIPSFAEWARAAAGCVKPGGRLYLRDGHPIKDTFDHDRQDEEVVCVGDYFGGGGAQRDDAGYTYTGDDVRLDAPVNFQWTHSLGTIVTALAETGLRIDRLEEADGLPWQAFPWMVQDHEGRWRFPADKPRLPLAFSIVATRPAT